MTRNDLTDRIDALYRSESRRILATLIRLLGDFDLAEEALADAFAAAVAQWPSRGVPSNPRAWLISAGRFRAIDRLRRGARFDTVPSSLLEQVRGGEVEAVGQDDEAIEDDQLRLIFTCCHPALSADARVALTLREVCGLTTEEIARAYLSRTPAIAQRIVRAKAKIRDAAIPYVIPDRRDLPARIDAVLQVVYLVFTEGYAATSGVAATRADLTAEAIRLGRLLVELLPEVETLGLLALMLLHDSRRTTRTSPEGRLLLLDEQDRSRWDRGQIAEGLELVQRALRLGRAGPYALQAAIAALHGEAPSAAETDWTQIAGLYEVLFRLQPGPVVELNRAVAIAMRDGPAAGLVSIEAILSRGDLAGYHLAHSARADLLRRLGRREEALAAYRRAFELAAQEPERRFLAQRIGELGSEL